MPVAFPQSRPESQPSLRPAPNLSFPTNTLSLSPSLSFQDANGCRVLQDGSNPNFKMQKHSQSSAGRGISDLFGGVGDVIVKNGIDDGDGVDHRRVDILHTHRASRVGI